MTDDYFLNNSGDHPHGVFKMSQLITRDMVPETGHRFFFFPQEEISWFIILQDWLDSVHITAGFTSNKKKSVTFKPWMILDFEFLILDPNTGLNKKKYIHERLRIQKYDQVPLHGEEILDIWNDDLSNEILLVVSVSVKSFGGLFLPRCLNFYQIPNFPYYTFSFGEGIGNMYCSKQIFDHHSDYFKNKSSDVYDSFLADHSHFCMILRILHGFPILAKDLTLNSLHMAAHFAKILEITTVTRKIEILHLQKRKFIPEAFEFIFFDMRRLSHKTVRCFGTQYCQYVHKMSGETMKAFVNCFFTKEIEGTTN